MRLEPKPCEECGFHGPTHAPSCAAGRERPSDAVRETMAELLRRRTAELEAMSTHASVLRSGLLRFGCHYRGCSFRPSHAIPVCDCGLSAMLDRVPEGFPAPAPTKDTTPVDPALAEREACIKIVEDITLCDPYDEHRDECHEKIAEALRDRRNPA